MPEATQMCLLQYILKEKLFRQNHETSHKQKRHHKLVEVDLQRNAFFFQNCKGLGKTSCGDTAVCKVAASQSRCSVGER